MSRISLLFGVLLIVLGLVGYFLHGGVGSSPTALIPAGFGLLLVLAGLLARKGPKANKHAMHVAALVGLLGTAGGLGMGLPKLIQASQGVALARPLAVASQVTMGILCLIFLMLCIRSFVQARLLK